MIEKTRILIADKMHASILPLLQELNCDVDYQPEISRSEIISSIDRYDGLIIRSKTEVNQELIDLGTRLKFVARAGAGVDQLDEDYLNEKKIEIINAPEGNRDALAEHAIGMLLGLLHKINKGDAEVRKKVWDREGNRGIELKNKTVGIYGYGNMGAAFAQKLSGFECKIIAYDKFKSGFSNEYVKEVDLEQLQWDTEILSLHVPLTNETRLLFDDAYLREFSNLKILLNTARGEILKLSDMPARLASGKLLGLGLDVLENEKLGTYTEAESELLSQLHSYENVLFTPHVGGWTEESYQRINEVIAEKLGELLK